jgi:hypothetical protein
LGIGIEKIIKPGGMVEVKRVLVAILLLIILIIISCAKDIIVKSPATLKGAYHGRYSVTYNYGSSTGGSTKQQWIEWTFTDYKFYCKLDELKPYDKINFCDFSGNYDLKSNISFTDTLVNASMQCDHEDTPFGGFSIIRKSGENGVPDSISMEQLEGTTLKVILLEKDTLQ